MTTETAKRFRLGEYVKDGHLAKALRNELIGLSGEQLALAQEAIVEVATTGEQGGYQQLLDQYRQAIRRAVEPGRKLVKSPQIDRKIVRNPILAAHLDKELQDVTVEEVNSANAALKKVFDEARDIVITGKEGEVRHAVHDGTEICRVHQIQHPTVPAEDKAPCGYFRAPDEWKEALRQVVRKALGR